MNLTYFDEDEQYEYAYLPDIDSDGMLLLKVSVRRKSDGRAKVTWILPAADKEEIFDRIKKEF